MGEKEREKVKVKGSKGEQTDTWTPLLDLGLMDSEAQIKSLASEVHHFPLNKVDVGWNLEALDEVAVEAKAEGGMVEM